MLAVVHSSISGQRTSKILYEEVTVYKNLIQTFAGNSIGRCGQTALTAAQITAWGVGAFATVADACILFTLINISATSSVHQQHVTSTEIRIKP